MVSIPDLPAEVILALQAAGETEAALWAWVSAQHYATLVAQNHDHLLVFVHEQLDMTALEAACTGFYVYTGQGGQAPTYTVGQLCRALVVKALYAWSYRQTEREIRSHSLVRWFVGYGLQAATLDHVTLYRFAHWVQQHAPRTLFDTVVRQLDQTFPHERTRPQVGDTFALVSRAREQSRTELLRESARRLLAYLAAGSPAAHATVLARFCWTDLFGLRNARPERLLDKPDRDALEIQTATAAHACLRLVRRHTPTATPPSVTAQALTRWSERLAKILQDEFSITTDDQGCATQVTHLVKKPKGSYRLGSAVDPAATFRVHGDQTQLGYNANLAATKDFIREIHALPGAAPDSTGVADLIAQQKQHLGVVPPKLIYDRAAGMPKIFADVARVSTGQTQLVARLIAYGKSRTRFAPSDFTLGDQGQLTCPNGQVSTTAYRSGSGDGFTYRFVADQCQGCPRWDQCRDPQSAPDRYRQVFLSDYVYTQRNALAYTKTAAFQADMQLRPLIERIIACLTRYHGARRATAYGLANADFQLKLAAVGFNLKRWHTLHLARRKPKRPQPPPDA